MKKLTALTLAASLSGCVIAPLTEAYAACTLLDIASAEADISPGWYVSAGRVLERCGVPNARAAGMRRACDAERRAGYAADEDCQ